MTVVDVRQYAELLGTYLRTEGEEALYRASLLSREFVQQRIGPDEIIALHLEALEQATEGLTQRQRLQAATSGLQFLLEVMIAYGVQHQEHLERRLRELADSEASRAEILAAVAHELRAPLTSLKGNLDLAERRLVRGQIESVPPLLGQSRTAIDRLVRMTSDLVDAGRSQPPAFRQDCQNVRPLLDLACDWASASAAEKGISLDLQPSAEEICVVGDSDGLLSVFSNLISNAVRYTPAGGRATVRYWQEDGRVVIEVADTGIGMTPEVRNRVFERFYRAPEARLAVAQGLGLGLSLVKQIVEAHAGTIEVESAPGEGSTFRVVLTRWTDSMGAGERD